MPCGGDLLEVPKEQIRDRVPAKTWNWVEHFRECSHCHQLFWEGTHWKKIAAKLRAV